MTMVVTCAFYGFVNRTTKVNLQVDREALEVGKVFAFEGDDYVILSVIESDGIYHANVSLAQIHRARTILRPKAAAPAVVEVNQGSRRHEGQEAALQARLRATETRLQHVLQERDEALKLLDRAIQQLDRLHRGDGTSATS
ncbi:MAG TPA: hypothetical protein VNP04_24265 [Alphaproteobacteria bacterium]|nr:hypothetical protein [Alphaproteobacteria bacterium]